jgi:hypothetical protein
VQQQETKSIRLIVTVKLLMVHYHDDCRLVLVIHSVTVELLMVYYQSECTVLLLRRHIHRRGYCRLSRRRGCDDVTSTGPIPSPGTMGRKQKEKKKNPSSTGGDVAAAAAIAGGEALNDGLKGTGDASGFVPVDGSWVAELEEALDELEGILESPGGVQKRRDDGLKV